MMYCRVTQKSFDTIRKYIRKFAELLKQHFYDMANQPKINKPLAKIYVLYDAMLEIKGVKHHNHSR
jgi:hypothetical protein